MFWKKNITKSEISQIVPLSDAEVVIHAAKRQLAIEESHLKNIKEDLYASSQRINCQIAVIDHLQRVIADRFPILYKSERDNLVYHCSNYHCYRFVILRDDTFDINKMMHMIPAYVAYKESCSNEMKKLVVDFDQKVTDILTAV